jgi:glycosyltransferase involved in cell wall biosynthesis
MALQCVVTSFRRPKYLEPCLKSMKVPGVEIYVVDGGSDDETVDIIKRYADGYALLDDNPGADVLKNEGIRRFVTNEEFCITSDDFIYPEGWVDDLLDQWDKLKAGPGKSRNRIGFAMLASPTELVIERHTREVGDGRGQGFHYVDVEGLWCMPTSVAMVAGTMMNTALTLEAGGFPVYGKTGQGDIAISRIFRAMGYDVGYLRSPVLVHLGQDKASDYPDYTINFDEDDDIYQAKARAHDGKVKGPLLAR